LTQCRKPEEDLQTRRSEYIKLIT